MFDIGGWEFLVIVVLAIVVIGPKDLPGAIRGVTQWVRKARALARDFQSGLDEIAHEAELDKLQQEVRSSIDGGGIRDQANTIRRDLEEAVDPDDEIRSAFADDDRYSDEAGDDEAEEARRRAEAEHRRRVAPGHDDRPDRDPGSGEGDEPGAGEAPPPARAGTGS